MSAPAVYALENLQSIMVAALSTDNMFSGNQSSNGQPVPIITEFKGDLVTELKTAIAKTGLCLVVTSPLFEFVKEWAPSLDGFALLAVNVFELVTLNQATGGTGIHALSAAQRVLALMHHFPLGLNNAFIGVKRPLQLAGEGPPLHYAVLFQAHTTLLTPQP